MNKELNLGVVGATGQVGRVVLQLLEERNFPIKSLRLFASARSAGKTLTFKGVDYTLEDAATLETIAEQAGDGGVPRVIPMAQAAADSFVVHDLDVEEERALGYGQRIASAHRGEETVAAIAPDGRLAAILDERAATAKSRVTVPA